MRIPHYIASWTHQLSLVWRSFWLADGVFTRLDYSITIRSAVWVCGVDTERLLCWCDDQVAELPRRHRAARLKLIVTCDADRSLYEQIVQGTCDWLVVREQIAQQLLPLHANTQVTTRVLFFDSIIDGLFK